MEMTSITTGRSYLPQNCVYILNTKQAALYIKNGLVLLDVLVCMDDKICFVFDKADSAPLYKKWQNYQLV